LIGNVASPIDVGVAWFAAVHVLIFLVYGKVEICAYEDKLLLFLQF
jgi:hypothetical protein